MIPIEQVKGWMDGFPLLLPAQTPFTTKTQDPDRDLPTPWNAGETQLGEFLSTSHRSSWHKRTVN